MRKIIYLLAMMIANYAIEAQVKTPQPSPKSTLDQVVGLTDVTPLNTLDQVSKEDEFLAI
jgi:hypothetical protein